MPRHPDPADRCPSCKAPLRRLGATFCPACGAPVSEPVPPPASRYDGRAERLAALAAHPDLPRALAQRPPRWRPLLPSLVLVGCALVGTVGVLLAVHAIGRSSGADWVLLLVGGGATAVGLLRLLDAMRHSVERHVVIVVAVEPSLRRANRPPRVHLAREDGEEAAYDLPAAVSGEPVEGGGGVAFVRARHLLDFVPLDSDGA